MTVTCSYLSIIIIIYTKKLSWDKIRQQLLLMLIYQTIIYNVDIPEGTISSSYAVR